MDSLFVFLFFFQAVDGMLGAVGCRVFGDGYVVRGVWCVVCGVWCVVCGVSGAVRHVRRAASRAGWLSLDA